jgi:hypothetical protein
VTVWLKRAGTGWSQPIPIHGTPPVTDMDAVRLVDLLGTGVSGVLWTADATDSGRANMHFLDLTGVAKPYLLDCMDNQLGALTQVTYAPSARFLLDARSPWQTTLPFPVQVVERVEVIDAVSASTTPASVLSASSATTSASSRPSAATSPSNPPPESVRNQLLGPGSAAPRRCCRLPAHRGFSDQTAMAGGRHEG